MILSEVNSRLRLMDQLEKYFLSMIQHWEIATKKTVTGSELLALKKLCQDRNLFQHLGCGSLIQQENSINEWLSKAGEEQVFKEKVQEISSGFKGKQKFNTMFVLIRSRADVSHGLSLKVIQLLDRISKDERKSKDICDGKFDEIDTDILEIITQDPAAMKLYNKLVTSKNLESDIASLLLKTSDESSNKMFRVDDCKHCGYIKETVAKMVEQAKIFKEKGNEFFKQNNYELANNEYCKIIEFLEHELSLKGEIEEERKDLMLAGRLNIAMCLLKQNKWIEARDMCNKVLEERTDG